MKQESRGGGICRKRRDRKYQSKEEHREKEDSRRERKGRGRNTGKYKLKE